MNKLFKFFLLTLVLLLSGLMVFLQVIKPRVSDTIKSVLNERLEARIDYSDAGISLFQSFPRITVTLHDLLVQSSPPEGVPSDTLGSVERFSVAFNALSLFQGQFDVYAIRLDKPVIVIEKGEDEHLNWDIFPSSDTSGPDVSGPGPYSLNLRSFRVIDGQVIYRDRKGDTAVAISGWNNELNGRFSGVSSVLYMANTIEELTVAAGGITTIDHATFSLNADIDADFSNRKFTFRKNRLTLNEIGIVLDGTVSMLDEGFNTDIDFKSDDITLKNLLSLVPALYTHNFNRLDAEGLVSVSGHVKGLMRDGQVPAFKLGIDVSEGNFGYDGVAVRAGNIDFHGDIRNPGGDPDSTVISVPDLKLTIGKEPFALGFSVRHPFSDPLIDASLNGRLILEDLQKVYPVDNLRFSGELLMNVSLQGRVSHFSSGAYAATRAYGSVVATNVHLSSDLFRPDMTISRAQLNFSPAALDLVAFRAIAGKSDFSATGRFEGYMPYIFRKGDLRGKLSLTSQTIVLDEFQNLEEEKKPLLLPEGVIVDVDGSFGRVVFGDMVFTDAKGALSLRDEKLSFSNITAGSLGGTVKLKGYYSTKGGKAETEFTAEAAEVNIVESYRSVSLLKTLAPVAEYAKGDVSANLDLRMALDEAFNPLLETLNGTGKITTRGLHIEKFPPVSQLGLLLDVALLDTIDIPDATVDFAVEDGKVTTKPFSFLVNDIAIRAGGVTGFDRTLDWTMELRIPKKYIGASGQKNIAALLQKLPLQGRTLELPDTVLVDAALKGSVMKPEIGLDVKKTATRIVESLKQEVQEKLTDRLRDRLVPGSSDSAQSAIPESPAGLLKESLKKILPASGKTEPASTPADAGGEEGGVDTVGNRVTLPGFLKNILGSGKGSPPEKAGSDSSGVNSDEGVPIDSSSGDGKL